MTRTRVQRFEFDQKRGFWGSFIIPTLEREVEGFRGPNAVSNMPTHDYVLHGTYEGTAITVNVKNIVGRTRPSRTEITVKHDGAYGDVAPRIADALARNYNLERL